MKTSDYNKRVGHRLARYPALALVLFLTLLGLYGLQPVVGIAVLQDDCVELFFDLKPGSEWQIEYLHSVAKVPVREIFLLMGPEEFLLIRTEYSGFGAGLPTESYGSFVHENGIYINSGLAVPFSEVPLRVGTISNHIIRAEGQFDFIVSDFFKPRRLIVIRPMKTFKLRALMLNKRGIHNGL